MTKCAAVTQALKSDHDQATLVPVQGTVVGRSQTYRHDPICYPPRGVSREEAARYIGVGTTKFDQMVDDGRMPKPKRIDGRLVWDRLKLDAAFSDLPDDDRMNPLDRMLRVGLRSPQSHSNEVR